MLKLYKYGNSICTQKVFVLLDAKKIDYEPINVDLFKNEQYNPRLSEAQSEGRRANIDSRRKRGRRIDAYL